MKTEFKKSTIKDLRLGKGMTQLEFARLIGTSRQLLGQWESGDVKPGMDSMVNMANACGVSVGYFFNETNALAKKS